MLHSRLLAVLLLASLAWAGLPPAHAQTVVLGIEPNDTPDDATPALGLVDGDQIQNAGCGMDPVNFFRVGTAPAPRAIYRHELELQLGGQMRLFGIDALLDRVLPHSIDELARSGNYSPDNVVSWYGFGRAEEIDVDLVTWTACRTAGAATLSTTTVTPTDLGTIPAATSGTFVSIRRASGATVDFSPAFQVFDAELRPVPGTRFHDPGPATNYMSASLYLAEGHYTLAIAADQIATQLPPRSFPFVTATPQGATDGPGIAVGGDDGAGAEMRLRVGTLPEITLPVSATQELHWFTFDIGAAQRTGMFCPGDGEVLVCPCGNDPTPGSGEGCENSLGRGAFAQASRDEGTYATGYEGRISFFGATADQALLPFFGLSPMTPDLVQGGTHCIGPGFERLPLLMTDPSGWAEMLLPLGVTPAGWTVGDRIYFQAAYRDADAATGCQVQFTGGAFLQI